MHVDGEHALKGHVPMWCRVDAIFIVWSVWGCARCGESVVKPYVRYSRCRKCVRLPHSMAVLVPSFLSLIDS